MRVRFRRVTAAMWCHMAQWLQQHSRILKRKRRAAGAVLLLHKPDSGPVAKQCAAIEALLAANDTLCSQSIAAIRETLLSRHIGVGKVPSRQTITKAKKKLRAAKEQAKRTPRELGAALALGGRPPLAVMLEEDPSLKAAALRVLRAPRHAAALQVACVSYDTARVNVRLRTRGKGEVELTLHVAGAISSAGCWLHPEALPPISGARHRYDTGAFVAVLKELRRAVEGGALPLQGCAGEVFSELAEVLQGDDPAPASGQAGGDSAKAAAAAAAVAAATSTPHFRATTRGLDRVPELRNLLLGLQAPAEQPERNWLLLMDRTTQHTSGAAQVALAAGQHSVWQVDRNVNPIEDCWQPLKDAVAGQVLASQAAAMQKLVEVWKAPQMMERAQAAMAGMNSKLLRG